ncbi:hypothetical protein N9F08_01115 [bacterium]|nr:hypothetical protein [bacterium]
MKKLVAAIVLSLMTVSASFAGENPQLWKEINRKLKMNVSQMSLSKVHKNYVVVKFKIVDGGVEILGAVGSEELRLMIVDKLEAMDIDSESNQDKIYRYKFNFRAEG